MGAANCVPSGPLPAMRTFLNLSSSAVALLLGLPALGQVQPDWRLTYTTPAHPAGSHDRLTAFALAPNGDIVWASHHNGFGTTPHAPLELRAELHRTSATGAPVWTVSPPPNYDVSYFNVALDSVGDCYFSGHAGQLYSNSDLL